MVIHYKNYLKVISFLMVWFLSSWLAGNKDLNTWLDVETYNNYFLRVSKVNSFIDFFRIIFYDPLFLLLAKPFTLISDSFTLMLFFLAGLYLFIKLLVFYKVTDHIFILLLLYFSYLLFLYNYVQIRIALSISFVLLSINLVESKLLQFVLLTLAILIHSSSIIVMFFWIVNRYIYLRVLLISCIGMIFLSPFLIILFSFIPKVGFYIEFLSQGRFDEVNIFSSMILIQLITLFSLLYFYREYTKEVILLC